MTGFSFVFTQLSFSVVVGFLVVSGAGQAGYLDSLTPSIWRISSSLYLLGTTFDFNRLGVTGPPEGLFTGWRRTRTVLPF